MSRGELELYAKSLEERIAEAEETIRQAQFWLSGHEDNGIIELQLGAGLQQEIDEQEGWIVRYRGYLAEVRRQLGISHLPFPR